MDFIYNLQPLTLTILTLSLASILGLWIGHWRVKGVSLGVGGVLFGGIIVGHFLMSLGLELNHEVIKFAQEFGLILFVYTVGVQVGPGFFASLRSSGLKLNALAALAVCLSGVICVMIFKITGVELPVILGIMSGAVTNTPSLAAGGGTLLSLGADPKLVNLMGTGYAMAYPFGICGIFFSIWFIRVVFRINIDDEASLAEQNEKEKKVALKTLNVIVHNPNLDGVSIGNMPVFEEEKVVCSRLKRGDQLIIPAQDTQIHVGDYLHLVGNDHDLQQACMLIGEVTKDISLTTKGTELSVVRLVVTNDNVLNKKIEKLHLKSRYDVVISRINRGGVELIPNGNTALQFGDVLNLVGKQSAIDEVSAIVGNAEHKLLNVQMLPIFLGIATGVLLGSIPIMIPGLPAPLKLGLAGGPLVVAIILGRLGSLGKLYWFMPPSANLALREIGIVLFLAVVGIKSGNNFFDTLIDGDGLLWAGYGVLLTVIPLLVVGFIARAILKINYLSISGLLAGSMTDPPALAFASSLHPKSGEVALSYATIYPLTMFLRIMMPQILAIMLYISA
ncbi:MAG: transporter [Gammaproteobacteria bacterium]|nr:MAG: transporter [Gammaproteobacteria bacterium]